MEDYLLYMKTLRSQMNDTLPLSLSLSFFISKIEELVCVCVCVCVCISNHSELRSVSNKLSEIQNIDVEDQTAKITVEEQMQLTTIQILEIDLSSGMYHVCNLCICMCFSQE